MKLYLLSAFPLASAFVGPIFPSTKQSSDTQLMATTSRRSMIQSAGFILGTLAAPSPSHAGTANPFFEEEVNFEPSQQTTSNKIDINGAIIVDYMQFPGMYPRAAGKIASHGPYANVRDLYKIPGLSSHDIAMFDKYKKELTVLPPGRMFDERINQRQST
uniref:Photosystem II 12 kDa extrinsic protein n=1 Tax=Skeletonema marinoi TaxID=267567 RepID=A0A7S2PCA6_9STRA|mmetsp:Transcript_18198/g.30857  ORF Transcript_18198/g.30857 Transcript_18198/m.30857 type:complete len:160 (+) Transcript_18198:64-543(+)